MNPYFRYEPNHAETSGFLWGLMRNRTINRPGFWYVMGTGNNRFVKNTYAVIDDFGDLVPVP